MTAPTPIRRPIIGRRSGIAMLVWLMIGFVASLVVGDFVIGFAIGLAASLLAWLLTAPRHT